MEINGIQNEVLVRGRVLIASRRFSYTSRAPYRGERNKLSLKVMNGILILSRFVFLLSQSQSLVLTEPVERYFKSVKFCWLGFARLTSNTNASAAFASKLRLSNQTSRWSSFTLIPTSHLSPLTLNLTEKQNTLSATLWVSRLQTWTFSFSSLM